MIVVGDIDPDAIEAKIKARFADWTPTGTGRADPDFGTPIQRGQEALVYCETGAPQYATVSWITPYDGSPDTAARRKRNRIEGIALSILNQRLAQAAQSADAPFLSAGASRGNTSHSARIASLQINYAGDRWQRALIEAEKIRRQVLEQGVTQQEVDRQITNSIAGAQADVASASTRTSRGLVGGLVGVIGRDAVFNSPENGLAMVEADLKGLTASDVNEALKGAFVGSGPLLFLSSTTPVEGGEATLASVYREATSATLADGTPPDLAPWPYTNFGTPGTVAETRKIDDLDVTFIRFANGVKLTVKPTKFRADQILVGISLAGGELAMPKDRQVINIGAYLGGGLEAMPFIDIRRTLPGKIYGVSFDVEDDAFSLLGRDAARRSRHADAGAGGVPDQPRLAAGLFPARPVVAVRWPRQARHQSDVAVRREALRLSAFGRRAMGNAVARRCREGAFRRRASDRRARARQQPDRSDDRRRHHGRTSHTIGGRDARRLAAAAAARRSPRPRPATCASRRPRRRPSCSTIAGGPIRARPRSPGRPPTSSPMTNWRRAVSWSTSCSSGWSRNFACMQAPRTRRPPPRMRR